MNDQALVLDMKDLLRNAGDDRELLDELADTFVEEVPGWIGRLRAAVSSGDTGETFSVAHSLNGAVAFFKAAAVQRAAAELEAMGLAARLDGAPERLDRLEAHLRELVEVLRAAPWRR
ncbi:MAG TPA: hypothetical protein DDZ42_00550 [Candidatus Rokubacteria bacterium]|nr:MAG: hypothetical protein A2050_14665 [Candidatus Rokubacteria bacterium GWA2_73_35]HBH00398.1 hypothetical protein [Candidatus Rokubacteria bacterium]